MSTHAGTETKKKSKTTKKSAAEQHPIMDAVVEKAAPAAETAPKAPEKPAPAPEIVIPAPSVPSEVSVPVPSAPSVTVTPPAPAAQVPTAPAKQYTLDELLTATAPLMDTGKLSELQALMQKYGVHSMMEIPADKYGELATDLRALGARL
ncbi:hypothetical protein [uncultured Megasphaera sp.]|uniref:hypothetical protein n=1 Tax=uncultured Megasphaera sp. TaxID=165188 RepID=UPI0025D092B0|nr:hypothetical protein [uncultured Megasphaera sp.]